MHNIEKFTFLRKSQYLSVFSLRFSPIYISLDSLYNPILRASSLLLRDKIFPALSITINCIPCISLSIFKAIFPSLSAIAFFPFDFKYSSSYSDILE